MKVVGITGYRDEGKNLLNSAYSNAFIRKGVVPVIVPVFDIKNIEAMTQDEFESEFREQIDGIVNSLDALVISGGADLNPLHMAEENGAAYSCDSARDFLEKALLKGFMKADKPVMGICRGFQLIGVHLKLEYFQQDLGNSDELHSGSQRNFDSRQEPCHNVMVYGGLKDYIFGKKELAKEMSVNSFHHQGFTYSASGKALSDTRFEPVTTLFEEECQVNILASTMAVLEAFESRKYKIFAVQWHPEEYGPTGKTIGYFIDNFIYKTKEKVSAVVLSESEPSLA